MKNALVVALLASSLCQVCAAQSTSTWIPLGKKGEKITGKVGASYLSMNLTAVRVYQKSNWWTKMIEKNRSAIATVTVSGSLSGGQAFIDKRVSSPISIQKNDSVVDFGWSQTLLRDVPVNFTSLQVEVSIAKTAQDGVDQLIMATNDLSKSIPALGGATAAAGAVTATKLLADFLFNKELVKDKLRSVSPLTAPAGTTIAPGFYAVLAGTNIDEYSAYTKIPEAGQTGLEWDGMNLKYNGEPLKLTYFVVEVAYKNSIFDEDTLPNSALTSDKNWARLYRSAQQRIGSINSDETEKFKAEYVPIVQMRSDAEQLLNEDSEFVQAERIKIQSTVSASMKSYANARLTELQKSRTDGTLANAPASPVNSPSIF